MLVIEYCRVAAHLLCGVAASFLSFRCTQGDALGYDVVGFQPIIGFSEFVLHDVLCYVLACFHPPAHKVRAEDYEWDGQQLAHIEWHTGFECLLNLLRVFDEETEREDENEAQSEVESGAYEVLSLTPDAPQDREEQQVGDGFIELSRMAWLHIHLLKDKCPWHVRHLAYYLGVHKVAHAYAEGGEWGRECHYVEYEKLAHLVLHAIEQEAQD